MSRQLRPVASGAEEPLNGFGTVVSVEVLYASTELVGAHLTGVTTLQVRGVSGLPGSGVLNVGGTIARQAGGAVLVGGDEVTYDSIDDLSDPDTTAVQESISLTAATTVDYTDRTMVTLTPLREYKEALVVLDSSPDVVLTCLVDHRIEDALEEGPRADGEGEIVWVEQQHGEDVLVAKTIRGRRKKVDGGYLHPTKPVTPGAVTTSWLQNPGDFASTANPRFLANGDVTAALRVLSSILSGGNGFGTTGIEYQGMVYAKSSGETASAFLNTDEQADRFRGIIETIAAVLSGSTLIDGALHIGQSTPVKLHSETLPPTVYPTGVEDWPFVTADFSGYLPSQRIGLALKSDTEAYSLVVNGTEVRVLGVNPGEVSASNPTGGEALGEYALSGGPSGVARCSLAYSSVNDKLITLGTDGTDWLVEYWAMPSGGTCVYDSAWSSPWTHGEHPGNPEGVMPAIGCTADGGQDRVILAQTHRGDDTVNIAQYLDAVFDSQVTTDDALALGDLAGVASLSGGVDVVLASARTLPGNPYLDSTGNFALPIVVMASGALAPTGVLPVGKSDSACAGVATLDGDSLTNRVWYASRSSDLIIQHSNPLTGGKLWLKGAWCDSATGGLTLPGDWVLITKRVGTRTTAVLSARPSNVDSGVIYAASGNFLPANSNWHAQNTPVAAGPVFVQIFNIDTGGANPVLVSTFPTGAEGPSWVESADGSTIISADYSHAHDLGYRMDAVEAGGGGGGGGSGWNFIGGGSSFETGWGLIDGGDSAGTGSGNIYGGHS